MVEGYVNLDGWVTLCTFLWRLGQGGVGGPVGPLAGTDRGRRRNPHVDRLDGLTVGLLQQCTDRYEFGDETIRTTDADRDAVIEVEIGEAAALDVDTPEAYAALKAD